MRKQRYIAYFSMEIGLDVNIPTYSGGLGILAGDTIRSAADEEIPMVAVTLLHRKGYFFQKLDEVGAQIEQPVDWKVEDCLQEVPGRASVIIEGREVLLRAWKTEVRGISGGVVPIFFLDADLPENTEPDRTFTHYLYGGDARYRLCQEVILGIGGVRILRALGYKYIVKYHMNEGHAAFLGVELMNEVLQIRKRKLFSDSDIAKIKSRCVFTTHTPVSAGHDQFPRDLVERVLEGGKIGELKDLLFHENVLNMTYLALKFAGYINGVAKKHGEISRHMFGTYSIDSITNGVHAATWVSPRFQPLFDRYIPNWKQDNFSLRYALNIPREEIWAAHEEAKAELLKHVNRITNVGMNNKVLTIGFARRITPYKRNDLLFSDVKRLMKIAEKGGGLQLIFSGKAHPCDVMGKDMIRRVVAAMGEASSQIKAVYLPNYDIILAKLLTAGVDVWLNTPQPPLEASGTSGMKAALNGVPSLSILDGWWLEGCIEGVTGWAIGTIPNPDSAKDPAQDAQLLYDKLETGIVPLYNNDRNRYIDIMRNTIALNGSFFNTQRMLQEYVLKAYFEP
ncbi:MAG: alpha-glucan family phosphorylase [Deltaproteobacteria bacterium]|nr:alpha-glucan family phosphorylase [Deltaproteobacteria bacterium]